LGHKRNKRHENRHHVIPDSRGGSSSLENIARVGIIQHQDYHTLFVNRTPVEIIHYLADYFWKGNYDFVREAYERRNEDLNRKYEARYK